MTLSSELKELAALHEAGQLSDSEYWVAKRRILSTYEDKQQDRRDREAAGPLRGRENADSPHPMRVVLSVFALLGTILGVALAAVIPFGVSLYDGVEDCQAPILEVFDDGYSLPSPPAVGQPSSSTIVPSSGKYADLFAEAGRYVPNYCRDEAITRTTLGVLLLVCGLGALLFLWRQELALRKRWTRR